MHTIGEEPLKRTGRGAAPRIPSDLVALVPEVPLSPTASRNHVLIVDGGTEQRPRWVRLCAAAALEATTIARAEDAQAALRGEPPALILYDVDGAGDGLLGLRKLRESRHLRDVPVLAMSADQSETFISEAFETGADDVIRRPIGEREFVARVKAHARLQQSVDELSKKERDAQVMLELTQALASSLDFREILFTVVRRIAEVVNVARASIVLAPLDRLEEPEQGNVGYVVVASGRRTTVEPANRSVAVP